MPSSYTLGPHYEAFISRLVESGRYATASEVLRDSLRLLEDHEDLHLAKLNALREHIRIGLDSGPGLPADEVFDALEQKYAGNR
jgi:antitoxin ParD1/3/4